MPRHGLQLRLLDRDERPSVPPRDVGGREHPELPVGIPDDPVATRPVHVDAHHLLPYREHVTLLHSRIIPGNATRRVSRNPTVITRPSILLRLRRVRPA